MASPENSMRFIYSLTEEDLKHLNRYQMFQTPKGQLWLLAGYIVSYLSWLGVAAILAWFSGVQIPSPFHPIVFILAAVWWLFWLRVLLRAYAWQPNQPPGLLGTHTVELSPQGVSDASETYYENLKWTAITRVVGRPTHLFLYLGNRFALVIPRRAFSSSSAADSLLEAVKRWHAAANPKAQG